ncbi:MAG: putative replication protein [Beijing sediment alphaflexivirus]|nr:MAG: putative replication protein [Beijing sediment alphaflexivirus]
MLIKILRFKNSCIQEEQLQILRKTLQSARTVMPYAASPGAAEVLQNFGIITNPFSAALHPHAACKAIENQLLKVVGLSLPKDPVTFYFLKKSKLNALGRNPRIKDIFNNHTMEPRDFARYEPDTVRSQLKAPTTPIVYISDTLHFLKPAFLASLFAENPVVQTVYATIVLPPEAFHRHPSQMPDVYSINYDYGGFQYIPGTHGGGAYHHEFSTLQWLKIRRIRYTSEGNEHWVTAQMLESMGANHLFVFSRGHLLTPRVRTFRKDEYVTLPQLFHPKQHNASKPIGMTFAMQLLMYVKSVKEVTFRDVCAKIRQLIPTNELHRYQPDEIIHMANFFHFVGYRDAICHSPKVMESTWFTEGFHEIRGRIMKFWEKFFGKCEFSQVMEALDWTTFTYSIEPEDIYADVDIEGFGPKTAEGHWTLPEPEDLPGEAEEEVVKEDNTKSDQPPPVATEDCSLPWKNCMHILNSCGFKGDEEQYHQGALIMPISEIRKLPDEPAPEAPAGLIRALEDLRRHAVAVEIDVARGKAYASDVKNNRVGMCTRNETTEWKKNLATRVENSSRTLPVIVIHGAGGSGKSYAIQNFLRRQRKGYDSVGIVLPTVELRADWMAKVPHMRELNFRTYEKALIQPSPATVVMDDYTKFPAGFIEAFVLFHPEVHTLILTGDPRQTSHHETNDQALSAHLPPAHEVYSQYCRYYLNATHRNRKDLANMLGVYSEVEGETRITCSALTMHGWPIIAPSLAKKTCLTELGHRAYSYAGCQGLTTPCVQVLLDNNTALCSQEAMYTTLSRARDAIHFINTGPDSADTWQKLSATPYLKTFLDLTRDQVAARVEVRESAAPEVEAPATHFPVENREMLLEPLKSQLVDKYDRELFDKKHGHTNAVQTEDLTVQLFQHQQAKDEALLFKTIEARIKVATPRDNEIEYIMKKDIGDILFLNYQKAMKLPTEPVPFCQELWNASAAEVQERYLSKPTANLINGRERQSPDFPAEKIALFLKSQWVKKTEKLGALNVKPGQTIASFMQQTVMIYGTMARYMRRIRKAYQPQNIFITCENTPEELNDWVLENWCFKNKAHSNDFTAFDQSQDGAMLQFEVIKAKHHNIPEEIIQAYVQLKTNAYIFLGTVAIMRLSGEGPTFDANTECAIAYHHTKYDVPADVAQLYAGDDMAQDETPVLKPSFSLIQKHLTLTSKEVSHKQIPGDYATFCGWSITPQGILKEPKKLFASLQLAKQLGKVAEVRLNYAQDLKHAYRLGDRLQEVFTAEDAAFHQATVRDIHLMGCNDILNAT